MEEVVKSFISWTKLKIRLHVATHRELYFKEREIWWMSIGVNIGNEQNGKHETFERPVLVVRKFSHDLLWVLPMTSRERKGIYYFLTEYHGERSAIILSQLRTVSVKRLLRKIRTLPKAEFYEVRKRMKGFL